MIVSYLASAALSAIFYSSLASAEPVQYCPVEDICYQVAVPTSSADSNGGNIYLQLRAPTSYSWVAFGTGSAMADSNIFVMYSSGTGNVTVSARAGTGHTMPRHNAMIQLELLGGSGLTNNDGTMIANLRCGNCGSWPGGSVSLSSQSASWIAAWKEGAAIDSTDTDAAIRYHDAHDAWTFDLTQGVVTDDSNPFLGVRQFDNNNRGVGRGSFADPRTLVLGHGIIMAVVMVLLYPLGSSLMPLFGKWILHASWQFLAFLLMWAGFGLGIVASQRIRLDFNSTHTLLGTVVVCLMVVQPVLGWVHHRYFVKNQTRGLVSHAHIWYGRALLIMGVVNGGLGLQLADASQTFVIAYSVVAGIMFAVYIAAAVFGEFRRRRRIEQEKSF
ncbi:CBD9-like protein [Annulohypoxylon maeteangense]|uniref:CBD9-like protein n=1 Tax=Annulohypoxylon maeteangense TaxID=1927788 RepID=UPI00200823E8|nr:CBD9-like protein [Annulohypoxylon maeteangense]KAI0889403.1 CBD9-like protein [Annulohypoxylon maeteangense]